MDLKLLKTSDLVSLYSSVIKELKDRSVIRTNNVIGDLGEYLAIDYYNNTAGLPTLAVAPVGTENIDAISRKGVLSPQVVMLQVYFMDWNQKVRPSRTSRNSNMS